MKKLISEIKELHTASQTISGSLCRDHGVELDNIDQVLFAIDHALVSIRTLDKLLEDSDKTGYVSTRNTAGEVVRGLTGPRNAAVHFDDIVEPDVKRAVGPIDGHRFIIYPRWKMRSEIPPDAFSKTAAGSLQAYDSAVAGRLLSDTLMDALKFFDVCDKTILPRDAAGQISGLPLPPMTIPGYIRLHPDWPSHEEAAVNARATAQAKPPEGDKRRVIGWLVGDDGQTYICGWTERAANSVSFTEPLDQVLNDIRMGFPYEFESDGWTDSVQAVFGEIMTGGKSLDQVGLPNVRSIDSWAEWANLVSADAEYYRLQRNF